MTGRGARPAAEARAGEAPIGEPLELGILPAMAARAMDHDLEAMGLEIAQGDDGKRAVHDAL
jgi:hypothetical protein